ncbi:hypothetical protein E8E12_007103 [Didymella heteroderae]|uniref:Uncharacterized protein n=1 Tax=Didymella heteroderae TaxID=1769908 RepID=A0A9P4WMF2_9PLEO|nr:hypothetical protein E8E12_007103 [Didymella heteroderae]
MPAVVSSPLTASLEPTSPAVPVSLAPTSPPTSPAHVDDTVLKATDVGIKKPAKKKQTKRQVAQKAKANMQKMHAFTRAHRDEEQYKDRTYQEIWKALCQLWKTAPKNPKNSNT